MPELDQVEREYRALSARLTYAMVDGDWIDPAERARLDQLAQWRVDLTAPDLSAHRDAA